MASSCKICRLEIAPGQGTTMQAFGRSLFVVHPHCAQAVHASVRLATVAALSGLRTVLAARAPRALLVLEQGAKLRERLKETTAL